jgi:hypothetical protein
MATSEIGRDAINGQFIPVEEARRRKDTSIVEKRKNPKPSPRSKGKTPTKKRSK